MLHYYYSWLLFLQLLLTSSCLVFSHPGSKGWLRHELSICLDHLPLALSPSVSLVQTVTLSDHNDLGRPLLLFSTLFLWWGPCPGKVLGPIECVPIIITSVLTASRKSHFSPAFSNTHSFVLFHCYFYYSFYYEYYCCIITSASNYFDTVTSTLGKVSSLQGTGQSRESWKMDIKIVCVLVMASVVQHCRRLVLVINCLMQWINVYYYASDVVKCALIVRVCVCVCVLYYTVVQNNFTHFHFTVVSTNID